MNFSAREQLWSPLRNKGWPGIHFILAKEGINPVSRHHPSANKNWFHPSFFATMTCHVLQPLFLPCSYYSLRIGFWLLPDFRKKQQKSLQININNSPDQQERSGPTPNSVSKKALGTKQSLPFDSQGLSAKQRHLYLAPKLEGTGSFLMDHWNMINAPNFIFQPSFFEGCVSFQRDLGVYFSLLVGWSYRLLGSVTPSNSPRWVIQNSSLNSNPLSISITCSTTPFVSIPFCEVGFSPLAISPLVNVGNHLPPSVKARNFGPIHLRAAPPRIKSPSFFLEVAQQKHNQPKKYVHIMPWN